MTELTIDPGQSSGSWTVCTKQDDGSRIFEGIGRLPGWENDMVPLMKDFIKSGVTRVWMEDVGYYFPADRGKNRPELVKFGIHCGIVRGVCRALWGSAFHLVKPDVWMNWLQIPGGMVKAERKRLIHEKAKEYFPDAKITLQAADSAGMQVAIYMNENVRKSVRDGSFFKRRRKTRKK